MSLTPIEQVTEKLEENLQQEFVINAKLNHKFLYESKNPYDYQEREIIEKQSVLMAKADIIEYHLGVCYLFSNTVYFPKSEDIKFSVCYNNVIVFQKVLSKYFIHFLSSKNGNYQRKEITDKRHIEAILKYEKSKSQKNFESLKSKILFEQDLLKKIAENHEAKLPVIHHIISDVWLENFYLTIARYFINVLDGEILKINYLNNLTCGELKRYATNFFLKFSQQFNSIEPVIILITAPFQEIELQQWYKDLEKILDTSILLTERAQTVTPYIKIFVEERVVKNNFLKYDRKELWWDMLDTLYEQINLHTKNLNLFFEKQECWYNELYNKYLTEKGSFSKSVHEIIESFNMQFYPMEFDSEKDWLLKLIDQNEDKEIISYVESKLYSNILGYQNFSGQKKKEIIEITLQSRLPQYVLTYACRQADFQKVKWLLNNGYKVSRHDELGYAPIHCALMAAKNTELLELISKKDDFDIDQYTLLGHAPIHIATIFANTNGVEWLVRKGVNINAYDIFDKTCLHYAAYFGHLDILDLLLTLPNIHKYAENHIGITPLAELLMSNMFDKIELEYILEIFKKNNCNLSVKDWKIIADNRNKLERDDSEKFNLVIIPFLIEQAKFLEANNLFFDEKIANILKFEFLNSADDFKKSLSKKKLFPIRKLYMLVNFYYDDKENFTNNKSKSMRYLLDETKLLIGLHDDDLDEALNQGVSVNEIFSLLLNLPEEDDKYLVYAIFNSYNPEVNKRIINRGGWNLGHKVIIKAIAQAIYQIFPEECIAFAKLHKKNILFNEYNRNDNFEKKIKTIGCFDKIVAHYNDIVCNKKFSTYFSHEPNFLEHWSLINMCNNFNEFAIPHLNRTLIFFYKILKKLEIMAQLKVNTEETIESNYTLIFFMKKLTWRLREIICTERYVQNFSNSEYIEEKKIYPNPIGMIFSMPNTMRINSNSIENMFSSSNSPRI